MAESESVKVSLDCTQNPRLKAEAWRLIYTVPEIHEWKQKPKGQFTMHIKSITESEGGIGQFTEHCCMQVCIMLCLKPSKIFQQKSHLLLSSEWTKF